MTEMTNTANVDPAELAKFSELAHRWWDKESEFRPLHEINPLRLAWIDSIAPLAGKQVLDVGCGGGILADAMARKGAQVLGIDLATKSLKVAQLHALEAETPQVSYREISAEALALEQLALQQGKTALASAWKCWNMSRTRTPASGPAPNWCVPVAGCFSPPSIAMPRRLHLRFSGPNIC